MEEDACIVELVPLYVELEVPSRLILIADDFRCKFTLMQLFLSEEQQRKKQQND